MEPLSKILENIKINLHTTFKSMKDSSLDEGQSLIKHIKYLCQQVIQIQKVICDLESKILDREMSSTIDLNLANSCTQCEEYQVAIKKLTKENK